MLFHSATICVPSGLCDGDKMTIVLSRIRRIRGVFPVAKRYASSIDICAAPTSVEWMLICIATIVFPSAMSGFASASLVCRGS